ncbi:MAG: nucleotidyltransferase [Sulfuritalea sp.]|nr:nucleotidyltransferase [Sulfuritalea sp.]
MSHHDRSALRHNAMRRNIAALAARLMAEDGIDDYGLAKRKAARQLGAPETEALPNNAEIEAELRTYQAFYQEDELRERLREMRRTAVEVMRLLEPFRPYLIGPVLDGTAGRYAAIELEAFPDSAKEVEIFLLNHGIKFDQNQPRRGGAEVPECVVTFDSGDFTVRLSLYEPDAERSHKRRNGRLSERARLPVVESLLLEAPAT